MERELVSLASFVARFNTDEACADYLFQIKWPNGFVCPRCDHPHYYKTTTRRLPLYECAHCYHQASLTVGTVWKAAKKVYYLLSPLPTPLDQRPSIERRNPCYL